MNKYNKLYLAMTDFFAGDVKRIQHFVKVHSFAKIIGEEEGLDGKTQEILEAAALVHDIGIKPAEEKYGRSEGKLQEQEGPAIAEKMLHELEFAEDVTKRVAWLVAHHHTYSHIEAPDHQILVEADFLVNFYEGDMNEETIRKTVEKIFKTKTGKSLAEDMYFRRPVKLSDTWAEEALQDLEDFIEEQGVYIRQ